MTNAPILRWSRITITGRCLVPELEPERVVDGLVDFNFDEIEAGSFVVYQEDLHGKVKKVLGKPGEKWEMRDGHILIGPYVRLLSLTQRQKLNGYNECVPDDCLLVGSNESPDKFMFILHKDIITRHIPLAEVFA
jgi:hypothetical protein|tara:strand:- start:84 stop:488 length:405 start_codon:yes stop_codon:yes gene_type:complete